MTTTKAKAPIRVMPGESFWGPWLTRAAFVLTLIVMIARALMMETIRAAFGMPGGPTGPGAATTMLLNALCCVPALLVLLRRVIDREYVVRCAWSHALLAALAAWAAASGLWASDKFVTAVSAATLIAGTALVWSTAQLVRSWLRLRIVAGVCFGLLLVYAAHGLIYRFIDSAGHEQFWIENKDEILRQRGWEPESAIARQFERKFLGRELIGFNESPNSFAAVIVLFTAVTLGVAIQRRANGDPPIWSIAIAAACAPGVIVIYFTHSNTALGTLFIAIAALALLALPRVRKWLGDHSTAAYWTILALFSLAVAAVVGHGVYHGSLPHASLNFRWRYWVAATELFKEHSLFGVGWGNFGPHYLSVRVPAAAEEIRDPHNIIVRAFAELGLVGGMLMLLWLARAAWELTRPTSPAPQTATTSLRSGVAMIVSIIAGGIFLAAVAAIDFSQNSDYILLETFRRVLYLGLLCVGVVVAAVRTMPVQQLDDRPSPWVLYGVLIGLGVFFVHNLVDFVLGEAGPMIVFAVLLGAAGGARMPSAAGARRRRGVAIGALLAASVLWIVAMLRLVIPIVDAEQQAAAAERALAAGDGRLAAGLLDSAYRRARRINADYAYRAALASVAANAPPERAKASLDIAIATNPANAMYYLTRARLELRQPAPDVDAVRSDYQEALSLDPQNIEIRLEFAELLQRWNDRAAAAEQYNRALETNRQYDEKEPERLSPARVKEIEELVKALRS